MTDLYDLIAETLAVHAVDQRGGTNAGWYCLCGGWSTPYETGSGPARTEHRRHVADVLLAALGDRVLPDDVPNRRQYGRLMPNGLVLPSNLPDPTHYRVAGPWRPVDTDPEPGVTYGGTALDGGEPRG